mgnify:CR=1 FL=1
MTAIEETLKNECLPLIQIVCMCKDAQQGSIKIARGIFVDQLYIDPCGLALSRLLSIFSLIQFCGTSGRCTVLTEVMLNKWLPFARDQSFDLAITHDPNS